MMDVSRIRAEEDAVAATAHGAQVGQVDIASADLASQVQLRHWLEGGGTMELRTPAGTLVGEVAASSVALHGPATWNAKPWPSGVAPVGACSHTWVTTEGHGCVRCEGHAGFGVEHECPCGATLPI